LRRNQNKPCENQHLTSQIKYVLSEVWVLFTGDWLKSPNSRHLREPCYGARMATTVSRGVYHHGKRHRFSVTPVDDSPEAFQAALVELDDKVRAFTNAALPKVDRQSYRKRKGS